MPKKCKIREDLIENELSVPVGDGYVSGSGYFEYRESCDGFQIKDPKTGKWGDAYSIDFFFE